MLGLRSNSITHRDNFAQPSPNFYILKQVVALTGRNSTGQLWSVGRAAGPPPVGSGTDGDRR